MTTARPAAGVGNETRTRMSLLRSGDQLSKICCFHAKPKICEHSRALVCIYYIIVIFE